MLARRRLDDELVARGLATDRAGAGRLIASQRVLVGASPALAVGRLVAAGETIRVLAPPRRFVTRGGRKLDGALDDLSIDVDGRRCLDAGAGTGGFTDCLLQRGAAEVVAVDVGYGDFAWALRTDPRVRLLERTNLRTMDPGALGPPFDLVVADLSFISLEAVAGPLVAAAAPGADLLLLVKPQFEAPRAEVEPGGLVTDPEVRGRAVARVAAALWTLGIGTAGAVASQLPGAEGNREIFLWARAGAGEPAAALDGLVTR
jgi:23S rRNA (cytidine1920-2'-O)/16S rRNA (cytidine1409-2'-O)-methyltransferase